VLLEEAETCSRYSVFALSSLIKWTEMHSNGAHTVSAWKHS